MSFVKTLAALAAGVAATKGYSKFREAGGMAGLQKSLQDNPMIANNPQLKAMFDRFDGRRPLWRAGRDWTGAI